jgi:hypothetical protein
MGEWLPAPSPGWRSPPPHEPPTCQPVRSSPTHWQSCRNSSCSPMAASPCSVSQAESGALLQCLQQAAGVVTRWRGSGRTAAAAGAAAYVILVKPHPCCTSRGAALTLARNPGSPMHLRAFWHALHPDRVSFFGLPRSSPRLRAGLLGTCSSARKIRRARFALGVGASVRDAAAATKNKLKGCQPSHSLAVQVPKEMQR